MRSDTEECFRLKWENFRDGLIVIHKGWAADHVARFPLGGTFGAFSICARGPQGRLDFPAPIVGGPIEASTLKKQHAAALDICGLEDLVPYTLRHTCLTQTEMNKIKRYVHPNQAHSRQAMSKFEVVIVLGKSRKRRPEGRR